jgi:hypothetical protein
MIREQWFLEMIALQLENTIQQLTNKGLYFARNATSTVLVANWTEFSNSPIAPLAEFAWIVPIHPIIIIHKETIRQLLSQCIRKKLPKILLNLLIHNYTNNKSVFATAGNCEYDVFSHSLLNFFELFSSTC